MKGFFAFFLICSASLNLKADEWRRYPVQHNSTSYFCKITSHVYMIDKNRLLLLSFLICILLFLLTEDFGLILFVILSLNGCAMFYNDINFGNTFFDPFRYDISEFSSESLTLNIYCLDIYQNCWHPRWEIIYWNGRRVHRFIICQHYMMSPLVL